MLQDVCFYLERDDVSFLAANVDPHQQVACLHLSGTQTYISINLN